MKIDNSYRQLVRKFHLRVVLFCLVAVLLNIALSRLTAFLKLPIWLDTVGTIAATIYGGYLPGIIVAFATNAIKGIFDSTAIYYTVFNILIALVTHYFHKKGLLSRVAGIILFIITISLIGGGLGGLLPYIIKGLPGFGFLPGLLWDFVDKTITVAILILLKLFVPKKITRGLYLSDWKQNPLKGSELSLVRDIKCRTMNLRSKMMMILVTSLLALSTFALATTFFLYHYSFISSYKSDMLKIAYQVDMAMIGKKVDNFIKSGQSLPDYLPTRQKLLAIKGFAVETQEMYIYKVEEDGMTVVFDLTTDGLQSSPPGTKRPFNELEESIKSKLLKGVDIDPMAIKEDDGWTMITYYPMYDDDGNYTSHIYMKSSMFGLESGQLNFTTKMAFIFMGFVIMIIALITWFLDYNVIYPINSITARMTDFAFSDDNANKKTIDNIANMDIRTGDEVENLFTAFLKMTQDSISYMDEIRDKNETIMGMQSSLIMVLADMVENRDKNTGQHIHKTAAYVEIILKQMKREGLHPDIVTDEYINNVVTAAPLHDIGKIKISDTVLCKPGLLTDDERKIIQQHTVMGKEVIDRVIAQVEETGYLREAKDLAMYHHEKWDGTGYPNQIAGEEIPLSARVMAVADVFDALSSERVYKKAFSFEESMEMIKKDAGTHFDPEVVRIFAEREEEVRQVSIRFKEEARTG